MSNPKVSARPRRVTRQREAGAVTRRDTRRRVLAAAAVEFADRGYAGATVTRIADRAGVAVPTLYAAWGSKRALLRGVMGAAVTGNEDGFDADLDRLDVLGLPHDAVPTDGEAFVRLLVHRYRLLAERAAVGWTTYRDAAAVNDDVAADWQQLHEERRQTFRILLAALPSDTLRLGLSLDAAVDTAWAIASPETHELFVGRLSWTYDQYEDWVAGTLVAALIDRSGH